MKISVVIPAFNEEKYLPACLASLKKQTFDDFEIIVVDNNSTDQTTEIAKSYGARVVMELQPGLTHARQRGFGEAQSDIIARTDADSTVSANWLEVIHTTFKNNPHLAGITGNFSFDEYRIPKWAGRLITRTYLLICKTFYGHEVLLGPNMAVRKSAWTKISVCHHDNKFHEDLDLSCHLSRVGKLTYVPHMTTSYSLRRFKHRPVYTFFEYWLRNLRTLHAHHL